MCSQWLFSTRIAYDRAQGSRGGAALPAFDDSGAITVNRDDSPELLYAVAVVCTAVLAGFMISYVVTMGSFFTHTLSHGRRRELQRLLLPFNRDEHVSTKYAAWVLGQVVVAAVSLALNAGRAPLAAQIFAVAAMPLWYVVHVGSGFARAEHLAEGGPEDVPEREIKRFLRLNLPIHCGYAAVYIAAALWLLAGLL